MDPSVGLTVTACGRALPAPPTLRNTASVEQPGDPRLRRGGDDDGYVGITRIKIHGLDNVNDFTTIQMKTTMMH